MRHSALADLCPAAMHAGVFEYHCGSFRSLLLSSLRKLVSSSVRGTNSLHHTLGWVGCMCPPLTFQIKVTGLPGRGPYCHTQRRTSLPLRHYIPLMAKQRDRGSIGSQGYNHDHIALSLVSRDHSLGSTFGPQTIHYNHYCMGIKFNEELANNCYHIGVSSAQSTGYLFIFGDIFRITKASSNYCLGHIHIKKEFPYCCKTLDISTVTIVSIL